MVALATNLNEFSDKENSRTYVTDGHTTAQPRIVAQRRRVPQGNQVVSESVVDVVFGTKDASGAILPQKISFEAKVRLPVAADAADIAAAKALFREVVACDEFDAVVDGQMYLK